MNKRIKAIKLQGRKILAEEELEKRSQIPMMNKVDVRYQEKEFNRAVLECDLRIIRHKIDKLNSRVVNRLDDYFDKICMLAGYDAEVFKGFFRRLIR